MEWTHFTVEEDLPGTGWGTGGIGLADFDGDGDLDLAVSRRDTQAAYWYERRDDATWVRHEMGSSSELEDTLGAAALDVDDDGHVDVAFNGVWFENPGDLDDDPDADWTGHEYDGGGHDVVAADLDGDGRDELVTYDGETLAWFDTARDLAKRVVVDGRDDHGGVAPRGVGDLSGDGTLDLVLPGVWFENPGLDGTPDADWTPHEWPHEPVPDASYGTSARVWVADLNGDGHEDIVYSDCDTGFSHVYWVENHGGGEAWTRYRLPDPPGAPRTGSFHSLGVADFTGDGTLDVFAGEQEDDDDYMTEDGRLPMKPPGLKERGVVWRRSGGRNTTFDPVVFQRGKPGWHDAAIGDVDGDGDVDIVNKVWSTDGTYHVDFWRNDTEQ